MFGDMQGVDRSPWVSTAYFLTSMVTVAITGKCSDLFTPPHELDQTYKKCSSRLESLVHFAPKWYAGSDEYFIKISLSVRLLRLKIHLSLQKRPIFLNLLMSPTASGHDYCNQKRNKSSSSLQNTRGV